MRTRETSTSTSFYLTEDTLERVRAIAKHNGINVSTFYRTAILAMLKRFEDFEWIETNEDTLPGGIHHHIDVADGEARIDNIIGATKDIDTPQTVTPC